MRKRLRRASLKLGNVKETVPVFVRESAPAPVAFVSFDLDLYSSTRDALMLFDADYGLLLPRVICYFDDIMGLTYSDFNGERLAISEFNANHAMKKLSPIYGLKYFVPDQFRHGMWFDCLSTRIFTIIPYTIRPSSAGNPSLWIWTAISNTDRLS